MKLITQRQLIKNVAKRFFDDYGNYMHSTDVKYYKSEFQIQILKIYEQLLQLDLDTVSVDEVKTILGRFDEYIELPCTNCGKPVEIVVEMDISTEAYDHDAYICLDCLKRACQLMEKK